MNSDTKNGDMTNTEATNAETTNSDHNNSDHNNGDQLFSHPVDTKYVAPASKAANGAANGAGDDGAVTYPVFSDRDR